MGKNEIGGKHKHLKNKPKKYKSPPISEITPNNETTFFCIVTKLLGCSRASIKIFHLNTDNNATIKTHEKIENSDFVLVEKADLKNNKGENLYFIIHKYEKSQRDDLERSGHITSVGKDSTASATDFDFSNGEEKENTKMTAVQNEINEDRDIDFDLL
jgi:hypothetical protein